MREKTANEIALHQATINELKEIKHFVTNNADDDVRFTIETRRFVRIFRYGFTKT